MTRAFDLGRACFIKAAISPDTILRALGKAKRVGQSYDVNGLLARAAKWLPGAARRTPSAEKGMSQLSSMIHPSMFGSASKAASDTSDVLGTGMGAAAGGYGMNHMLKPQLKNPMDIFRAFTDKSYAPPNRLSQLGQTIGKLGPSDSLPGLVRRLLRGARNTKLHPGLIGAGAIGGGLAGLLGSKMISGGNQIKLPGSK